MVQVTWSRLPPFPYMVKTFKNLLLQNQKSYDLETWHVALGTQALQSLYKWWPWVDLDLFYGKVKLGRLYVISWRKLAAKDLIDWIIVLMKKSWPQGVVCPCPRAIYMYMTTIFMVLSASVLSGLRWTLAQIVTQKNEIGKIIGSCLGRQWLPFLTV